MFHVLFDPLLVENAQDSAIGTIFGMGTDASVAQCSADPVVKNQERVRQVNSIVNFYFTIYENKSNGMSK